MADQEKKYVKLDASMARSLDQAWNSAQPETIDGIGTHAGIPGLITVTIKSGKQLKLRLKKGESGDFLLGFDA